MLREGTILETVLKIDIPYLDGKNILETDLEGIDLDQAVEDEKVSLIPIELIFRTRFLRPDSGLPERQELVSIEDSNGKEYSEDEVKTLVEISRAITGDRKMDWDKVFGDIPRNFI